VTEIVTTIQARQRQKAQTVEVLFADEAHWSTEPYVQRGWCRKGKKTTVPGPAKRQTTTIFGALHLSSQKVYWKRAPRGTSKGFIAFLHQLHQRFPDALLLLILDNATIHKSRAVKQFVNQHDWIELEHLAPYSPEYNPIERFWKWLKAKVYGATAFRTIAEVIGKIRQIVWHYNEGWLTSTIRFVFEPYQEIL
jgi:transposase